ncbi:DUF2569 domain-containing protein [Microvirga flavescens]|uniref:DUF2569 domain-containing protein n=1 Tax=Microvirga flavescens TaxID=2249811 RepID=UPI000DD6A9E5|nr:DUF2569 domain-containing protein [Microvirga flavescens]
MTGTAQGFTPPRKEPVGIGGWLILPIIGFIGTLGLTIFNLSGLFKELDGFIAIFSATSGQLAEMRLPVALSMLGGVAVILSAGACLVFIFQKKPIIVKAATAHYLILVAASLIELWGDARFREILPDEPVDPKVARDTVRVFMTALIWIPYFHVSKRVKNTFRNPVVGHNESASAMRPAPLDANS